MFDARGNPLSLADSVVFAKNNGDLGFGHIVDFDKSGHLASIHTEKDRRTHKHSSELLKVPK